MTFATYILRCADGSFYVGHSDNLTYRIAQHQSGQIAGYTSARLPVELAWSQEFTTRDEALAAEKQIKGWSRVKKEALIAGDWNGVQLLSRKLFLRYGASTGSAPTQDERAGETDSQAPPTPLVLSSGLSEAQRSRRSRIEGPKGPIIILVQPQLGQNIGKAARAMLNFGLTELRLVAPRDGWPNPDAGPAASGADLVLEQAQLFDTVAEAVADCSLVFASTVRKRDIVTPVVGPEEMAAAIHAQPGRSAILFGPERSGLATEDVVLASHIVTVPINPQFGSLNLAQAVILLAYEWSRQAPLVQPTAFEVEPRAPQAELDGLIEHLDGYLSQVNYFNPPERMAATRNTIRTIFTKPGWSSREIKAVRGMIRAIAQPRIRSNSSNS
jgi:tRNA/rRNA methyltransferase